MKIEKTNSSPQPPVGPFCQSCGMPLAKPGDFGTESFGVRSNDYCAYCYKDGAFISPDMTMEQMRELCVDKMVEFNVMPRDRAAVLMRETLPRLKRWTATPRP